MILVWGQTQQSTAYDQVEYPIFSSAPPSPIGSALDAKLGSFELGPGLPPLDLNEPVKGILLLHIIVNYWKDSCGINTGPYLVDHTLQTPTSRDACSASLVLSPRLRLSVEAMRAQDWSLASQHGMYRLVLTIAPHHGAVQQPKAFVAIEQADGALTDNVVCIPN